MIAHTLILKEGTTDDTLELERIGPFDQTFFVEAVRVKGIIVTMIHPMCRWVYIKAKHGIALNGHKNYMILSDHFLGPGNMDHLAGNAAHCF